MNFKNKLQKLFFFLLLICIIPLNVFAYSSYIVPGGETVGIEVNSKGVLVVGFYQVDNSYPSRDAGFLTGDIITKVDDISITNIDTMIAAINSIKDTDTFKFTILRDNNEKEITTNLKKDSEGILKTGLYVKDEINGIGTLTYIDPANKKYGALGHEIVEKATAEKFEIKDGKIYDADVTSIEKSSREAAGEKNATYSKESSIGTIDENTESGIFGTITKDIDTNTKLKVAKTDEIHTGNATIRTVISNDTVEEFTINILKLDNTGNKNILFEITDKKLLDKTGGIVQGMSGSPIIQDKKIVGAVTHVIVNNVTKGYGIFITTMLEEGEN